MVELKSSTATKPKKFFIKPTYFYTFARYLEKQVGKVETDQIKCIRFILPEPDFTYVLEGFKGLQALNVNTDKVGAFTTNYKGLYLRIEVEDMTRMDASKIKKIKGLNSL